MTGREEEHLLDTPGGEVKSDIIMQTIKNYSPGLMMLGAIALLSTFLSGFLPPYLGALFIAIILGLVISNVFRPDPQVYGPGVKLGVKRVLKLAIVLLGAGITFQEILGVGLTGLSMIVGLIVFVFSTTLVLGRFFGVKFRRSLLIAVGISICGNTAIAATAPVVAAEEDEIAMAVGIVTLFGVLSVLAYPLIGHYLGLSDQNFGFWAGTAINDTSQVVAAGFMYSEAAGRIATTVKLTRNIMIVPVVLLVGHLYARQRRGGEQKTKTGVRDVFPTFVLGFLLLASLNSFGVFGPEVSAWLVTTSKFLILFGLSGIGMSVDLRRLVRIGARPFWLGFFVELLLAIAALGLVVMWL